MKFVLFTFLLQDIDFPDFSEAELKEMALKFPCRVELFHSNVCNGVEKSWPRRLFGQSKFQDLLPHQKRTLIHTMLKYGVKLYDKYVDKERLQRRRQQQRNLALAEYYEERFLRNQYVRLRALGDNVGWSDSDSDSDCSLVTVIDNTNSYCESESASNESKSTDGSSTNEADSNSIDIDITKGRESSVNAYGTRNRKTMSHGVSTRSRKKAAAMSASRSKTSINEPLRKSSNQLVSTCQIRKLRTNLPQNSLDDGDMLFLNHKDFPTGDDGIAMLVEVANQNIQNDVCKINIVEHIDTTEDSFNDSDDDDNDGMLIIDESFNDALSQTTESSYGASTESIEFNISPPKLNTNEFVRIESLDIRYMHESFNESVELFLSQINTQIN